MSLLVSLWKRFFGFRAARTVEGAQGDLSPMNVEEARRIYRAGEEVTVKKLMELDDRVADLEEKLAPKDRPPQGPGSLSTPSAMRPPYSKPAPSKRRGRPGRKKGHPGAWRAVPTHIDQRVEHTLSECPQCHHPLGPPCSSRTQVVEDIPPVRPTVTENVIHSYECPHCHHRVEAPMPDALPKATLGLRLTLLTAFLHYSLGMTTRNICTWLRTFCQFHVTPGGLALHWQRLAQLLQPVYDGLAQAARHSAVLNVDESGWRIRGRTAWLWCFTNQSLVYFVLAPSRAGPVVKKVLGSCFPGILITDFFGAYNKIKAFAKQRCIVHLLRELKQVSLSNPSQEWRRFARRVKRLVHDALKLIVERQKLAPEAYQNRVADLHLRLADIFGAPYTDHDCERLAKRLAKHSDEILTFLLHPDVPADNNHSERQIRGAVVMRKNSYGNQSPRGALAQAILMSLFRTCHLLGMDPIVFLTRSVQAAIITGSPLPLGASLAAGQGG